MFIKKYRSIMAKPEEYRKRWALGLTIFLSSIIFVSFAFYKGFLSFGGDVLSKNQVANVISADVAPSPLKSVKGNFGAAFKEIGDKYREFKDSLSAVFVPFVTGIEVYERK